MPLFPKPGMSSQSLEFFVFFFFKKVIEFLFVSIKKHKNFNLSENNFGM